MNNIQNLKSELRQFCGSEQLFRNPLFPKYTFTEGVRYLAEQAQCFWLIDYVFSNQHETKLKAEHFQTWKLKKKASKGIIIKVEDGNKSILKTFELDFTDFPFEVLCPKGEAFNLWLINSVLMLPSEY